MNSSYFNYVQYAAYSYWERRRFINRWWRIYHADPRWAPPSNAWLHRQLTRDTSPHLARLEPLLLHVEAFRRGRSRSAQDDRLNMDTGAPSLFLEEPVAALIALLDPRRQDRVAHLGLLRTVNDRECLQRTLDAVAEPLAHRGSRRIVGPTGLSPHLGSGILLDHFHRPPPQHSAYNPPYAPELFAQEMRDISLRRLFVASVDKATAAQTPPPSIPELVVSPAAPARLTEDLLPLLVTACTDTGRDFPPPDALEAQFLVEMITPWNSTLLLACIGEQPVGFVWLQPDFGELMWRANGGRGALGWARLAVGRSRRTRHGRLLFGAVDIAWQRRGIGRTLWQHALRHAAHAGWDELSVGPVAPASPGGHFLAVVHAEPRQHYALFARDL